ncbi:MAG TPA: ROK family protein, partial [Blastocatellia bacterium]|nr:ROK family protein [Blastocatellia bacterium]
GGTRIKAGLVDDRAAIITSKTLDTPPEFEAFKEAIQTTVASFLDRESRMAGIGIGCKGVVNSATTRIEALPGTFRFLEGVCLSDLVKPVLTHPIPLFADNDARAALAGEVVWGVARGLSDAVMLTLGTGIGGGILADGRILRGARGVAGHLGHLTIDPDGPMCSCGNRGCLETFFSALAIEASAMAGIHIGCESALTRPRAGEVAVTCKEVFDAAAAGDYFAGSILDRSIAILASALAGLAHALDPQVIILGGQITEAGSILFEPLKRAVWQRTRHLLGREVPVVRQGVADSSGLVGAAALARMGIESSGSQRPVSPN